MHPRITNEISTLVEIPLLQSVDFKGLLNTARKVLKRERISNYKMAKILIRNRIIEPIDENKYKPTNKGKTLFELLKYYLSL